MNPAKYEIAETWFLKYIDGYKVTPMPMHNDDYKYYYVGETLIFCYNIRTESGWFTDTEETSMIKTALNLTYDELKSFYRDMILKHFKINIKETL